MDRGKVMGALDGENYPSAFISAVERIVQANIKQGRLDKFLANGTVASEEEYIRLVVRHYKRDGDYVWAVQNTNSPDIWEPLFKQLRAWAFIALGRRNFLSFNERQQHAKQCAIDAAMTIRARRFPYDAYFQAWAHVVVTFVCANHVRKARSGRSVPIEAQISLDAWDGWSRVSEDPLAEAARRRVEQQYDLMQHITDLSEAQQRFVLLYYFEDRDYDEIAELMGRSKNALYKLNFDALANLRKKLLLSQHNYE